ncbi:uncharacterized protein LOC100846091 [Brachypodium distachyon]|uniref:DUF1645 family protein n=1 Tax=Brachypodium distachyon TaxID=15368 RepID=I1HQ33_BRADI|nr:uncharacterized protein LOC100846091 [Brachypodium distachyon]KQK09047.1 hypothetical protein BRADI_2g45710v3 [Brachypodium distachyon]|eukprot:XP_003566960.1 uncharacterized protein LOC100846091 [Brachypodium distachyon]
MEDRDLAPAENLSESPDDVVGGGDEGEEEEGGGGFTFPVLAADACVVPVYPIFGRPPSPGASVEEPETATVRMPLGRLLLEERDFRARQRDDEEGGGLEGVAPESYCLWAPGQSAPASPRRCRKSGSTGSVLRWRRISDRLVGRSHSDGKEKFVFLTAGSGPPKQQDEGEEEQGGRKGDGVVGVGDRGWSYYGRGGGSGGAGRRKSYLPYKQELVGLFANVGGLRRSYPPF